MRDGALNSLLRAMRSWRTAAVVLLSFSSGLPLGLVWYSIPDWMRDIGVDIRVVGLFTLAQAPWAFKVLWSPLMDRYVPPFWGRRRGWMALTQVALAVLALLLAGVGQRPETLWVVGALTLAIAVASASQDIAYDAYTVEVLRDDEQGAAVGARIAMYRAALVVAGGAAITLAGHFGWPAVNALLALMYVPMLFLTWKAPEPERKTTAPATMREAVWQPFIGFLSRHRAIEILGFVFLYKLADNLTTTLTRPFLIDMGYTADHRGIALATIGLIASLVGSFVGGWATTVIGLGHALWVFGILQTASNFGYVLVAWAGAPNLPLMYSAIGFEMLLAGMGTGAYSVFLLRITQKRFSATQYALFSSLFAIPRVLAGGVAGVAVDALGWSPFFLCAIALGAPGLIMLQRFAPLGVREPQFTVEELRPERQRPSNASLALRGVTGGAVVAVVSVAVLALLDALKTMRETRTGLDLGAALWRTWHPTDIAGWLQVVGIGGCSVVAGLFVAAALAARHGAGGTIAAEASPALSD